MEIIMRGNPEEFARLAKELQETHLNEPLAKEIVDKLPSALLSALYGNKN